jgi:hypothetical protein
MKTFYATFALLAIGVLSAAPSLAVPTGSAALQSATENLATPVASYECRRDDRGWHYMRGERRTMCRPSRPREGAAGLWGWRCEGPRCGWWHRHEHRWHDRG